MYIMAFLKLLNWSYIIKHPIMFIRWLKILNNVEKYGIFIPERPILGMKDKRFEEIKRSMGVK